MTTTPNSGQGPEFDPTSRVDEASTSPEEVIEDSIFFSPRVARLLELMRQSAKEDGIDLSDPEPTVTYRHLSSGARTDRSDEVDQLLQLNFERPLHRERDFGAFTHGKDKAKDRYGVTKPDIGDERYRSIIPIPRIPDKYTQEILSHIPLENSKLTDQPMLDSQRTNPDKNYQIINPNQIGDENKYPGLYEITPLTYGDTYPDLTGVSKEQYLLPLKEGAERSVRDILGDPLYAKVAGFYSDEELLAVLARIQAKAKADSTFETKEVREPGGIGMAQWSPSPRQLLVGLGIITREQQMDLFLADLAAKHGFSKPSRSEATGQTNDMKPEADYSGDIGPVPES